MPDLRPDLPDPRQLCGIPHRELPLTPPDLSAPVDVYYDWVDACDAVAKDAAPDKELVPARLLRGAHGDDDIAETTERDDKYDDDDGFVVDDEGEDDFGDKD